MHNIYNYVYVYSITKTFVLFPQSKKVLNLTQTPLQEVSGYYQMLGFSRNIKTIKLRVKGGQPAMPRGASWLAAVRNLLKKKLDEGVDYFLN